MILKRLEVGQLGSNCYIVGCSRTRRGIVIDPGADAGKIQNAIHETGLIIELIILTHYHFDHVMAAGEVQDATGAKLAIHAAEAELLADPPPIFRFFSPSTPALQADRHLHDGDRLELGDLEIDVLHTPGHSPGGISLHIMAEGVLFSGDALFREGIGRTDFPGSDPNALVSSIREKLYALDDETIVYPGHGPKSTIGWEKRNNPFVPANPRARG